MDSAYMYHSSHYDAGVTRRIFGDVSLNCDDDIYSCSQRLPPASYSPGKPGVTPGHPRSLRVRAGASRARDEYEPGPSVTRAWLPAGPAGRARAAGYLATVTRRSDAAMAAAAAPGSDARVMGRPITSRSAPASSASSGVATRA